MYSTIKLDKPDGRGVAAKLIPSRFISFFFLGVIALGTILFALPWSVKDRSALPLLDALFLATSSVCVTGLSVIDVGSELSVFGQIILLLLIQLGGLGYMVLATLTTLAVGRLALSQRLLIEEAFKVFSFDHVASFVRYVLKVTLTLEAIGACALFFLWDRSDHLGQEIFNAVFHSVSAFCNAGFSLFPNSLERFTDRPIIMLVFIILIVSGGLGFVVLNDLYLFHRFKKLSTHTKVVLATTVALVGYSWLFFFISEFNNPNTMGQLPFVEKVTNALFLSVTPRTAGFNSVPTQSLMTVSLFHISLLMFVGASPGGTGGGIKTTSFCVILATLWATVRGRQNVDLFGRRMPLEIILKSFTVAALAFVFVFTVTVILLATEGKTFIPTFFEVASAFGTVGLSTGITPELSKIGKMFIIFTMYVGRLGPLTLGLATFQEGKLPFKFAEEKIMVG